MDSSAKHPVAKVSTIARVGAIVANVGSVFLLGYGSYVWMRERETLYLVMALLAAFNLVVVVAQRAHARRKKDRHR
jgi:hypothetical protein